MQIVPCVRRSFLGGLRTVVIPQLNITNPGGKERCLGAGPMGLGGGRRAQAQISPVCRFEHLGRRESLSRSLAPRGHRGPLKRAACTPNPAHRQT